MLSADISERGKGCIIYISTSSTDWDKGCCKWAGNIQDRSARWMG